MPVKGTQKKGVGKKTARWVLGKTREESAKGEQKDNQKKKKKKLAAEKTKCKQLQLGETEKLPVETPTNRKGWKEIQKNVSDRVLSENDRVSGEIRGMG